VSRAATSFLDPEELIQQVVNLVRERFDLYYAGLFLVDRTGEWTGEPGRWAVLRAGTGEAGRQMMKAGHKLEIGGSSMIGWCVANAQARIALDVGEEAVHFENPWLPETHSEMALPLISRGQIVGAMSIQSTEEAAFSDEDIAVLQTMADQLAIAIENARLFEQAQIRAEREQLVRTITDKVRRGTDTEAIMRITVRELGQMLGASKSVVRLGTRKQLLSKNDGIPSSADEG
jgi:GAF domain-containing protein